MKTCRSGLHQYDGGYCPECHKISNKAWKVANRQKASAREKARCKANPEKERTRQRQKQKRHSEELSDYHICNFRFGLPKHLVPKELIEAKRIELKVKRLLKEMKKLKH